MKSTGPAATTLVALAAGLTARLRPAWRRTPITAADTSMTTGERPDHTKALQAIYPSGVQGPPDLTLQRGQMSACFRWARAFAAARLTRDPAARAHGTVKFFKPDKGWRAITSPDQPDGFDAWVHFSAIEMDRYRSLNAGDPVEFDCEPAEQDSFRFRRDPRLEAVANALHA